MLREGVERWHQRVALLAAFALLDAMAVPGIVIPSVGAALGVKLARVGQQRPQRRALKQPPQHGSTGDVVECPNSINRKDCCPRTGLSCCAEEADDGFSPSRRATAELEGQARLLEFGAELLRQNPPDQAAQNVANN